MGCQPEALPLSELEHYLNDDKNGLTQEFSFNGLQMQMRYRPTDMLVAQELGDSKEQEQITKLREKYGPYDYFVLSISQEGQDALYSQTSYSQFSETLQNLAFRMDQYVQLTTSQQDTIPLSDFAFPRLYGYGKSTQVLLVFNKEKMINDEWVQINVHDVGLGTGKQHFRFRREDLEQVPQLIF